MAITDVQTFIRGADLVHVDHPAAPFRILGPTDWDVEYFEESRAPADRLDLADVGHCEGRVRADDWLSLIDRVVAISRSEARPLVIFQAGACGVSPVAPHVGRCRELLERPAGEGAPGGLVTPLVDAEATAAAIGTPSRRSRPARRVRRRPAPPRPPRLRPGHGPVP